MVVALILYTVLNTEEEMAYKQINLNYSQTKSGNWITRYFKKYVLYKMWNFKKEQDIKSYFINKNRYKIMNEKYFLKVKANFQQPFKMLEFCKNSRKVWDDNVEQNLISVTKNIGLICKSLDPLSGDLAQKSLYYSKNSKKYGFKMYNMAKMMSIMGNVFEISCNI